MLGVIGVGSTPFPSPHPLHPSLLWGQSHGSIWLLTIAPSFLLFSFLWLAVESLFLVIYANVGEILGVSMGQGKPRILLLSHLPPKIFNNVKNISFHFHFLFHLAPPIARGLLMIPMKIKNCFLLIIHSIFAICNLSHVTEYIEVQDLKYL